MLRGYHSNWGKEYLQCSDLVAHRQYSALRADIFFLKIENLVGEAVIQVTISFVLNHSIKDCTATPTGFGGKGMTRVGFPPTADTKS